MLHGLPSLKLTHLILVSFSNGLILAGAKTLPPKKTMLQPANLIDVTEVYGKNELTKSTNPWYVIYMSIQNILEIHWYLSHLLVGGVNPFQ